MRPAAAAHRSDQARVEDRLRDAIVTGRFQPSERLVEVDVARELGVGRSAVRTALARLEHEGLVEHERHRGARVRLVGAREAVEILETRAVLEGWPPATRPSTRRQATSTTSNASWTGCAGASMPAICSAPPTRTRCSTAASSRSPATPRLRA